MHVLGAFQHRVDGQQVVAPRELHAVPGEVEEATGLRARERVGVFARRGEHLGARQVERERDVEADLLERLRHGAGVVGGVLERRNLVVAVADHQRAPRRAQQRARLLLSPPPATAAARRRPRRARRAAGGDASRNSCPASLPAHHTTREAPRVERVGQLSFERQRLALELRSPAAPRRAPPTPGRASRRRRRRRRSLPFSLPGEAGPEPPSGTQRGSRILPLSDSPKGCSAASRDCPPGSRRAARDPRPPGRKSRRPRTGRRPAAAPCRRAARRRAAARCALRARR